MQVTIDIEPKTFSLLQKVQEKGVSLDKVLRDALDKLDDEKQDDQGMTVEQRIERFNKWARTPRNLPDIPDEALRRENIYPDRA